MAGKRLTGMPTMHMNVLICLFNNRFWVFSTPDTLLLCTFNTVRLCNATIARSGSDCNKSATNSDSHVKMAIKLWLGNTLNNQNYKHYSCNDRINNSDTQLDMHSLGSLTSFNISSEKCVIDVLRPFFTQFNLCSFLAIMSVKW